ncbi:MAG: hypothetical protein JO122_12890 [Acetobacteraceae bacterium]|nr:hypothetical protein [Acetobacteraceae bacterium]
MNPATLSALSALLGSAVGALASLATTWLTQHYQDRIQRRAQEMARRERLFGDFIVQAAKLYADALTHDHLSDPSVLVPVYALKAQLGLFASKATTDRADEVLQLIIDTYYRPTSNFHSQDAGNYDILQAFTRACRAELDG